MITRRMFLSGGAATAASAFGPQPANAALSFGGAVRFSWEALQSWAEAVARLPYQPPVPSNRELIQKIDYDAHRQIRYRSDQSVWPSRDSYPVELFHVGRYFMEPVRVFLVRDGLSREVLYNDRLFSYGNAGFARALSEDTGFAGLRIMRAEGEPDWLSFLGASYFRAPGETGQYGLSARGLAIDTGMPEPEEFPRFGNFWIERLEGDDGMVVYALLDSPSVAGAYRIRAIRKSGVITDVDMVIHAREDVRRLGIAPLTSMYWYGKSNRHTGTDWRPEIHDSDGLAIWTGAGEHIWRPLNNPPDVKLSSFFDSSPKGFGLLQRERDFDAYQDDNVFYNRRPSVWVEPRGAWGEGAVQLLEIPTDDETKDNIVVFWNPKKPLRRGGRVALGYRLYWRNDSPVDQTLAKVMATRSGEGGVPGTEKRVGVRKFVVDFEGGELGKLENRDGVKFEVSASRGSLDSVSAYRIVGTKRWRGIFDYTPVAGETTDLRAFLELEGRPLSESWVFQHNESRNRR